MSNISPLIRMPVIPIFFLTFSNAEVNSISLSLFLAMIAVWLSGNLIVIFLAGLQNVPRVYHEAAEVDGANSFQRLIHITIPCMTPIIFYNLLMSLITNLQVITPALSLTKGGPSNGSNFMCYKLYKEAFKNHQYGYGSAVAVILFIIIAVFTIVLFISSSKWVL